MIIPYGKQYLDETDIEAVVGVLKGNWLTQGPMVEAFETALAHYCGAKFAIAVSNGTVALHLACLAAGVGSGDEGITSPITFIASANCLVYAGAKPVFADIQSNTWNISPNEIEKQITSKTKVIIPVHFAGLPCDMTAIRNIADRHQLIVIEDACHALGARIGSQRIGGTDTADLVCFSFHPVKHITTGEGGAILTDNEEYANKIRMLRHHGITKDPAVLTRIDGPWYYEAHITGYNARLSDIQCAIGCSQLKKIDTFLLRRKEIAERYLRELKNMPGLSFQSVQPVFDHAYHLFVAHFDPARYDRLGMFEYLKKNGIAPQIHYVPAHHQPVMKKYAGKQGSLPNADHYYEGCISLPMFPSLTTDQQSKVIDTIKAYCHGSSIC
ncbi:MAG: UDP-4-amino-4,6-dideoxy-N-acetyl-beta-L-altrosamine transaminase [Myxococcota bacterium]|nr:UDP-4-amino-4,6-dideoxy-N-acetyl-beta-L-altrosamine transaminase [Myxococcota bacterium]